MPTRDKSELSIETITGLTENQCKEKCDNEKLNNGCYKNTYENGQCTLELINEKNKAQGFWIEKASDIEECHSKVNLCGQGCERIEWKEWEEGKCIDKNEQIIQNQNEESCIKNNNIWKKGNCNFYPTPQPSTNQQQPSNNQQPPPPEKDWSRISIKEVKATSNDECRNKCNNEKFNNGCAGFYYNNGKCFLDLINEGEKTISPPPAPAGGYDDCLSRCTGQCERIEFNQDTKMCKIFSPPPQPSANQQQSSNENTSISFSDYASNRLSNGECKPGTGENKDKNCEPCSEGYFNSGGIKYVTINGNRQELPQECLACPPGEYQDEKGKTKCKKCNLGEYQDDAGKTKCKICQAGTFSNREGARKCDVCQKTDQQACTNDNKICNTASYSLEGQSSCDYKINNCPVGYYSKETEDLSQEKISWENEKCILLDVEKDNCMTNLQRYWDDELKKCVIKDIYFKYDSGETEYRERNESECHRNLYQCLKQNSVCKKGQGLLSKTGSRTDGCLACVNEQYQDKDNSNQACQDWKRCNAGSYQIGGSPSENTECKTCGGETYQPDDNTNVRKCIDWTRCDAGFYQIGGTTEKDASCQECGPETYQPDDNTNVRKCIDWKRCDAGSYQIGGSTKKDTSCQECGRGTYQPDDNTNVRNCIEWKKRCNAGSYQTGGTTKEDASCQECGPETYQPDDNTNVRKCIDWTRCDAGSYQTGGTTKEDVSCQECGPETYQPDDNTNVRKCIDWTRCSAGFYQIGGSTKKDTSCQECGRGTYQPDDNTNARQCIDWTRCDAGSYQTGGTIKEDASCQECPDGYYQSEDNTNVRQCTQKTEFCNSGYELILSNNKIADNKCIECKQGYWQPKDNTINKCKPWKTCDKGRTRKDGTTTADAHCQGECPYGFFQPNDESKAKKCRNWTECTNAEFLKTLVVKQEITYVKQKM